MQIQLILTRKRSWENWNLPIWHEEERRRKQKNEGEKLFRSAHLELSLHSDKAESVAAYMYTVYESGNLTTQPRWIVRCLARRLVQKRLTSMQKIWRQWNENNTIWCAKGDLDGAARVRRRNNFWQEWNTSTSLPMREKKIKRKNFLQNCYARELKRKNFRKWKRIFFSRRIYLTQRQIEMNFIFCWSSVGTKGLNIWNCAI